MAKNDKLIGQKFGKLTVVEQVEMPFEYIYKDSYWLCQCDCGNSNLVRGIRS